VQYRQYCRNSAQDITGGGLWVWGVSFLVSLGTQGPTPSPTQLLLQTYVVQEEERRYDIMDREVTMNLDRRGYSDRTGWLQYI
jgi:hypothetical protein